MIVAAGRGRRQIEQTRRRCSTRSSTSPDKEVHEVMVPRPEVVAISIDMPPEEASPP